MGGNHIWPMRWFALLLVGWFYTLPLHSAEYPAIGEDIYDTRADGQMQIDAALQQAALSNKRVLVIFGANYCRGCRALEKILTEEADIAALTRDKLVVLHVDVNKFKKRNQEVKDRYFPNFPGAPSVVLLEASGTKLEQKSGLKWTTSDKKAFDPEKIRTSLLEWVNLSP